MTFIPVATTLTAREGKGPNSDARDGNLVMETLRSHPRPGSNTVGAMMHAAAVRRLTPLECERLQGFPDGWTDGQSDASRYRQLGDSVAVPCIEWVARRLVGAHQRYATGRAA